MPYCRWDGRRRHLLSCSTPCYRGISVVADVKPDDSLTVDAYSAGMTLRGITRSTSGLPLLDTG